MKKIKVSKSGKYDAGRMYVEYEPKVSIHTKKIYFGPKAKGTELFEDILTQKHGGLNILREISKNPLA